MGGANELTRWSQREITDAAVNFVLQVAAPKEPELLLRVSIKGEFPFHPALCQVGAPIRGRLLHTRETRS